MSKTFIFGDFRLDVASWTLLRGSEQVHLQPKQMEVLLYLLENPMREVTTKELMDKVWPGAVVENIAVARNISQIRAALRDEVPYRYIESVRGGVYRFIEPDLKVEISEEKAPALAPDLRTRNHAVAAKRVLVFALAFMVLVGAAVSIHWLRHWNSKQKSSWSPVTFNSSGLPITAAVLSSDGQRLAFVEGGRLYVSDVKVMERYEVSVPQDVIVHSIGWFAKDMRLLAVGYNWRHRELALWDISLLGGKAQLLVKDVWFATCSPDESLIVFARRNELWQINRDGSDARLIARAPDESNFGASLQFSEDGKSVIVGRLVDGLLTTIERYRLDRGEAVTLYQGINSIQVFQLIKEKQLVLSQLVSATKYDTEVISMTIDPDSGRHSPPEVIGRWNGYATISLNADSEGKTILIVNSKASSAVYVANLLNHNTQISALQRLTFVEGNNRPMGWMPDGEQVLFASDRLGSFGIYAQAMGADSATALVADSHVNGWPAITSDGKWLYYFSFDMSGPEIPEIYRFMRKPLAGGEAQQVDTQAGLIRGLRCAVSVNLCIHAKQGDNEIVYFKVDPESGKLKEFSHDQMMPIAEFFRWDVSPDGRYLAHVDQTGQSNDIRIMSVDNPKDIRVMHLPQLELLRSLRWDAQSRGFFVSTHNDNGDMLILYHIGMDGTINMLRQEPGGVQGWVIPSPDGKRLAIQSWVFDGNIWMLKRN